MKSESAVETATTVYDFFQTEVSRLVTELHKTVPAEAQVYVANLCSRFMKSEQLFVEIEGKKDIEPLALMLKRALECEDDTLRLQTLRHLGDTALYTSGFLSERIERRGIEVDYVMEMGGMAYQGVSHIVARSGAKRTMGPLYESLAKHFRDFVQVLWEVADRARVGSATSLLKLYESWRSTGSERFERRLVQSGFVLTAKPSLC